MSDISPLAFVQAWCRNPKFRCEHFDNEADDAMTALEEHIEALERELADERTLSERYRQHRNKAEAQAAAMRKALEDADRATRNYTSGHAIQMNVQRIVRKALNDTDAGKRVLAVVESAHEYMSKNVPATRLIQALAALNPGPSHQKGGRE